MAEGSDPAPSGLFAIFMLTIYSLVLIPYTLYRVCNTGEVKAQAVVKGKKKDASFQKLASKLFTKGNIILMLAWVAWLALVVYVQSSSGDSKPFDPFEILGVDRGATEKEIKKAYRKLSLQYHPDKNPDPKAAAYFASFISKAYMALTDEISRTNYEKYGHPDGPQGMNLGVALPSWMFTKDRKTAPLMLLGLVGGCILLPLAVVSYYMLKGDQYSGPNRIHNATIYAYAATKYGVKESQSLVRIPETLMCAMEFIQLYTPNDHHQPMEDLRRTLTPIYQDVMGRDKKAFFNRRGSVVKAHMLLLAHLERMANDVPEQLLPDLKFVRQKCPPLLEEMTKIACLPRNNMGWGWMTPALACVEMMQCIAQGVPISTRKGGAKGGDAVAPLLALPNFDMDVVKKLRRQRLMTVKDLQALDESALYPALGAAGLWGDAAEEVAAALQALPQIAVAASFEVDGEDEICERDPVHCRVRVVVSRQSHANPGFKLRGTAVRAFTPSNPEPQDEAWYVFLTDPAGNWVLTWTKANLIDAEHVGLDHANPMAGMVRNDDVTSPAGRKAAVPTLAAPAAAPAKQGSGKGEGGEVGAVVVAGGKGRKGRRADRDDAEPGQVLDLVFMAPPTGRYDLTLHLMSSTWVGADLAVPLKLKVNPLTRAAAEGRDAKSLEKRKFDSDSEDEDDERESGAGSEGGEEVPSDEYDSEETGEEESGSEDGSDGDGSGGGGKKDD